MSVKASTKVCCALYLPNTTTASTTAEKHKKHKKHAGGWIPASSVAEAVFYRKRDG